MEVPSQGGTGYGSRTTVSCRSYVLNLSTFILKSDKRTENTVFVSFKPLEVVLGFGFPTPPRYNSEPEWRLNGLSDILLSNPQVSTSFGGGNR